MTQPTRTPNPATSTRPERSSRKVAHKRPLAWLPLALLALLALLAVLIFFVVRHAAGGSDHASATASTAPPAAAAPSSAPSGAGSGSGAGGGAGAGSGAGVVTGAPVSSAGALVGGAGIAAAAATGAGSSSGTVVAAPAAGTAGTVLFAEGSSTIDSNGRQVLTTAAKNLQSGGARAVQVVGYTDLVAGTPVNGPLSQQRADAVAAVLRPLLPGVTVSSSAKAEADPVATNATDAGRQQNRRVVVLGTT